MIELCVDEGVKGTILLAEEGVNSTIAGPEQGVAKVLQFIRGDARFSAMTHKQSWAAEMPFSRLKIRVKKEIVTFKTPVDPNRKVGTYVAPKDWNDLIAQDGVIVIDTRNDYEVATGKFARAIDPKTNIFSDFPRFVQENLTDKKQKIAMYCTGGIRCEKASSYLLQQGFEQVYHLQGGILKYLEEIPPEQSLWQGECFVFDQREALFHGLRNKKK